MENRRTSKTHRGTTERGHRPTETAPVATTQGVSVMDAVANMNYGTSPATHRESTSQEDLMSALGVQDASVKVLVPVRDKTKRRDRSTSRTRLTVEEKKQSIRESRARTRSRSRSNSRPSRVGRDSSASRSVTPSIGHLSRTSDCLLYTSPSPRDQRGSRMPSSA